MREDWERRAKRMERLQLANARWSATDPGKARRSELGRELFDHRMSAEARARSHAPDARRRAVSTSRERRLAWCPLEYQDDYRKLTRGLRLSVAEARRIIEDQIRLDLDRYRRTGLLQRSGNPGD